MPYQKVIEKKLGTLGNEYISNQIEKLKSVQQADVSESLPFPDTFFDTVMSIYSLGCLKSEQDLSQAIQNLHRVLKSGGVFLHINTNGKNTNDSLPAYTWNGVEQTTDRIEQELHACGFIDIEVTKIPLNTAPDAMYKYDGMVLVKAHKK